MTQHDHFYRLDYLTQGISRNLAPGLDTRIFIGDQAMLSVVEFAPNSEGTLHSHPEEQWGIMLKGAGVRLQGGEEITVSEGDFWRTPGNVEHTFRAGPDGARVLDVFAPPREVYTKGGSGFGQDSVSNG